MDASRREPGWVIGVDVGGTKIAAGAVDVETGLVLERREVPTQAERGGEAVAQTIESLVLAITSRLADQGQEVAAIGVGLPELVSPDGHIASNALVDWRHSGLLGRLETIAPTVVTSDVQVAARAEAALGAGLLYRWFVYVSIGTGISSAIVKDREPLPGARGGALVLSSGALGYPCGACGSWTEFVLEDYASGAAIARRFAAVIREPVGGASAVIDAARDGDWRARDIVDSAARAAGGAIAWLVNVLDPEAVVIGGGLGLAGGRFREGLVTATREHIWNPAARSLPLLQGSLGRDAGLIGAALAASRRLISVGINDSGPELACRKEAARQVSCLDQ
jgi:glucokinase